MTFVENLNRHGINAEQLIPHFFLFLRADSELNNIIEASAAARCVKH